MKNYSRQREAILEVLKNSKNHPTAIQVYNEVSKKIPNISLGTVYRNLSKLASEGEILNLSVGDGNEHYDGDVSAHIHLFCTECGKIEDMMIENDPTDSLVKQKKFVPKNRVYVVYGVCSDCNKQS